MMLLCVCVVDYVFFIYKLVYCSEPCFCLFIDTSTAFCFLSRRLGTRLTFHLYPPQVASAVKGGKYPFVMCNFAPPDMVGHTGVYEAAVKACAVTGESVRTSPSSASVIQ